MLLRPRDSLWTAVIAMPIAVGVACTGFLRQAEAGPRKAEQQSEPERQRQQPVHRPSVTQDDVIPILLLRCTVCHGTRKQEAGLDLRTKESMLAGGKSGPAMVPGRPEDSLILKRIRAEEMPPRRRLVEASVKPMPPNEIDLLTQWIAEGAPSDADSAGGSPAPAVSEDARQFWSFQPPRAVPVPAVKHGDRIRNPIDAFVLRKLEQQGLSLAPEADRETLLRRAYFDLTGLPPEPQEVRSFLADTDPLAYERRIDRLLASPRYGERWGRHWLDLAGYADSEGVQNSDPIRPYAYRYRDYVIRAFNNDKPYDRFLLEQLAGDELADYRHAETVTPQMYDNLVATGFLRMTPDGTWANITNFVPDRLSVISAEIEVFSSAVLGLTVKCARCHSHKFDPIPQSDYYRLAAVFKGAYDQHDWLKPYTADRFSSGPFGHRFLSDVTTQERREWEASEQRLQGEIHALQQALEHKQTELTEKHLAERLAKFPEALQRDLRNMLATPPDKRDEHQQKLAAEHEKALRIDRDELAKIDAEFKQAAEETDRQVQALEGKRKPQPMIRALWDRGEPSPTYVLRRGNYLTPGKRVRPGVPAVLADDAHPYVVKPPWPGAESTGRRLALARWLIRPDHPLTARVMVNRIWMHHFGSGIVSTPDNFGKTGARPTHPELLDWLAVEFVRKAYNIKAMHRLMMTSATYRQASRVTAEQERLDPDNRLLSRMPLKRMEAEVLRDTLLSVSGRLDEMPFGPPDPVEIRDDGLVTSAGDERGWRRSVYVLQRRTQIPTILENFDAPPMNPNCIERPRSNVAPQALHLMNNRLVHDLAGAFAQRVVNEVGSDPDRQIERVYLIALSRSPTAEERSLAADTLARLTEAWARQLTSAGTEPPKTSVPDGLHPAPEEARLRALGNFCHGMMNSAAFLYID